jgi:hypothetical protein
MNMNENKGVTTLAELLVFLERVTVPGTRLRDMVSAINRVCEMAGITPASVPAEPLLLREMLSRIRPAFHGVSTKSYSNQRSLLAAALQLAAIIDPLGRGRARCHPEWKPLLDAVADDQRLSNGIAAFSNWCANNGISPGEVNDVAVQQFLAWLETKTLYPKPRDCVRRVPHIWNEASAKFDFWPRTKLTTISFKTPAKHLKWSDLSPSFRQEVDAYLALRANPDPFDERPQAPRRPLAATTIRQQREHLRLAASTLSQNGEIIDRLADLVTSERFKSVLRYYHDKANREPNAFVIGVAKTIIQVAQYHAGASAEELGKLKNMASKLPAVPFDLTEKNKMLLRQLESERIRAKLLFLPEQLMDDVAKNLERGRVRFVEAQVAIAIDIQLASPLRPQNLSRLTWKDNFSEPNGPRGVLLLHIAESSQFSQVRPSPRTSLRRDVGPRTVRRDTGFRAACDR